MARISLKPAKWKAQGETPSHFDRPSEARNSAQSKALVARTQAAPRYKIIWRDTHIHYKTVPAGSKAAPGLLLSLPAHGMLEGLKRKLARLAPKIENFLLGKFSQNHRHIQQEAKPLESDFLKLSVAPPVPPPHAAPPHCAGFRPGEFAQLPRSNASQSKLSCGLDSTR